MPDELRAVFDTNVIVSAVLRHAASFPLFLNRQGRYTLTVVFGRLCRLKRPVSARISRQRLVPKQRGFR